MGTLNEFGDEADEKVKTEDLSKALAHPVSRQHFQVDPSEEELAKILHAPWKNGTYFSTPCNASWWKGTGTVL